MATWVLVCNAARGVLYSTDTQLQKLEEVQQFEHPESRAKARDLYTDDVGSRRDSTAAGGGNSSNHQKSGMDPHTEFHRIEAEKFAKEVSDTLRAGRVHDRFDQLIVIAPPRFLGLLRQQLDTDTARRVVEEVQHDWTSVTHTRELLDRLRDARVT